MQDTIKEYKNRDIVQVTLDKVQDTLLHICNSESSYSNHLTQYLINRGGKRLRPLLVILTSLHNCDNDDVIQVATAAELIHTASLVHDDIIDDSSLRRGVKTINNKWNNSVAVLVGDYLFAKSFEILSDYKTGDILAHFTKAISLMSIGELEQLGNRYNPSKKISQYYTEILGKTSTLISTCCRVGAIMSGMNQKDVHNLTTYGLELGYAFQIIDDLLDIKGEIQDLGKPVFKDFKEGNMTLPMILLLESSPQKSDLEQIILAKDFSKVNLSFIQQQLNNHKIKDETYDIATKHVSNAVNALQSTSFFSGKKRLMSIAEFVLERKK